MIDFLSNNVKLIKTILFIVMLFLTYKIGDYYKDNNKDEINFPLFINKKDENTLKKEYDECLNSPYSENDLTENLNYLITDVEDYIKSNNYEVSFLYEDLTTNFIVSYKPENVYYGCSLIKIVDALYLINKAINKEIDLDNEYIIYEEKYKKEYSSGMEKRKFGEHVSLRDLISYAISVSDNSAHFMLIDYIGFNNLKSYGESLGAKVILTGGDIFGNQTAEDTNIYLKETYRIINENEEYGPFLKSIMDNNSKNAFNKENIKIYHKYGSYETNFHDIGLALDDEYPYSISVFTLHGNDGYKKIIPTIHEKVRSIHNVFHKTRKDICYKKVYENEV